MKLVQAAAARSKRSPAPNGPTVRVYFGDDDAESTVGLVRVLVPVGAAMPEHAHNGSDVVLSPVFGSVEISGGGQSVTVGVGDAVLIRRDEHVALRNAGDVDAELIVAAGPANFISSIRSWPDAE